jgi:glycosyltransferase involved in cell wall biosynthesis
MKIKQFFFFLPNFSYGGAGNSILNICKKLKNRTNKILVISLNNNAYRKEFKKLNIKTIIINKNKLIFSIPKILDIVKRQALDKYNNIFISNINYTNIILSIFLKQTHFLKLVLTERTHPKELDHKINFFDILKKKIIKFLIPFYYKNASCIICNSDNVSKFISKLARKKVYTFYPITNYNFFKKKKSNKILKIIWIGRNSFEKNISDLIRSLQYLNNISFKLTIISSEISKIKNELVNLGIKRKINFIQFGKKNINNIIFKSDILISTSLFEGFPNVIAQAIFFNTYVISANNFGGARDLIKNKKIGKFYKLNFPEDLAKKIIMVKDKKLYTINNHNERLKLINHIKKNNKNYINFLHKI